jgi:vesicle coat complex subunit
MGCLRAEKIIDYLSDPLAKALKDENPYVRKTGALCVAKLYDIKPELAIDNGFVSQLHELVADSNPMVDNPLFICFILRLTRFYRLLRML